MADIQKENSGNLGDILSSARDKNNVTLAKMAEITGVSIRYLKAIESGDYRFIPPDVYTIGIIRKYAKHFNLDLENLISIFNEDRGKEIKSSGPKDALPSVRPKAIRRLSITKLPFFSFSTIITLIIIGVIGYFLITEIGNFLLPPTINLVTPSQDISTTSSVISIEGRVSRSKNLTINQQEVYFDKQGNFQKQLNLNTGVNTLEIKATNLSGTKVTKIERKVVYQPQE